MSSKRVHKSGTNWCLWRWTTLPANATEYITRLHLIKTPWFAVCLHWINMPDDVRYYHDHPVTFLSLILRGWYCEARPTGMYYRRWWNFIRARSQHTIVSVAPHTLTLALMGPKTQDWGFYLPQGKVYWKDYYREKR